MIDWPTKLIDDLARRRCIPYLGAGVSYNSTNQHGERPKLWEEFLSSAVERCEDNKNLIKRLIRSYDFLTACYLIKSKLDGEWFDLLEDEYLNKGFEKAEIHEAIYSLDSPIVFTTNFDKIYDTYAQKMSEGQVKVKTYSADDLARDVRGGVQSRIVIKAHGTVDAPESLIFSREDYANLMHKHQNFYKIFDSLVMTNTFLFIGCGLSDPDLSLTLEKYSSTFKVSSSHYILSTKKSISGLENFLKKNYNLVPLVYNPANNHEELTRSLEELVKAVDGRRAEIGGSLRW